MVDVVVRPVEAGDIEELASNMRASDIEEVRATSMRSPLAAVRLSVAASDYCRSIDGDGELALIFGVSGSLLTGEGSPWMLATGVATRHPRAVIRHSKRYIAPMLAMFPYLSNHVDARNTKSVAWLRMLGFTVNKPEPYGRLGLPFHKFEMRA